MAIDWKKARENNKERLKQERGETTNTNTSTIDWKTARTRTRIALATEQANAKKAEEAERKAAQEKAQEDVEQERQYRQSGSKSKVLSPSAATGAAIAPNWTERAATAASTSRTQTTDDSRPHARTITEVLQGLQPQIDALTAQAQQTDENGLGYYDTPNGAKKLKSGLAKLSREYSSLTGKETTFNNLASAQDAVSELQSEKLPTVAAVEALLEKNSGKDYAGYLAGEYGTGMFASPAGILSGAKTTLGDLVTNGRISEGLQVASQYFSERPELLDRWMANDQSAKWQAEQELRTLLQEEREQKNAYMQSAADALQERVDDLTNKAQRTTAEGLGYYDTETGERELRSGLIELSKAYSAVTGEETTFDDLANAQSAIEALRNDANKNAADLTDAVLSAYRAANTAQWMREKTADDRGSGISDTFKNTLGNAVYSAGQNAPGMIYGMAGGASEAGGIIGSVIDAKTAGTSAASAAATATKEALKGSISTWLIGLSAAGNQLNELAQQRGFGAENYVNALGHGFAEMFTEGLFGLADTGAVESALEYTGSTAGNILRALGNYALSSAEEGLEEFVNEPMGKIVDKMTIDHDMPLVGEGGVFDIGAMLEAGLQGALAGAVMGSVGAVTAINTAVRQGESLQAAANELNSVIRSLPEGIEKPGLLDAKKATEEDVEQKTVEILANMQKSVEAMEKLSAEEQSEVANRLNQSFEQGENAPVQNSKQAENSPVQNNAQAQTENGDIMSTSVQNEEAQQVADQNQEGTVNETEQVPAATEQQPTEQPAEQQPTEQQSAGGSDVLPGDGQERGFAPTDTGSAGTLGGDGQADTTQRRQNQVAKTRRDNAVQDAELKRVSAAELGIANGTNRQTNILLDEAFVEKDAELSSIRRRWREMNEKRRAKNGSRTEAQLQFVVNGIQVQKSNGETVLVDGAFTGKDVVLQADSVHKTATQLAEHEEYHLMERDTPGLTRELYQSMERMENSEQFDKLKGLIEQYREFYTEELGYTDTMVVEEIFADAYAGLERIPGTNMQQLQEDVREWAEELQGYIDDGWWGGLEEELEEEYRRSLNETRGPPAESAESVEAVEDTEDTEVHYSINEGFADDIDEWDREGRPENVKFVLGSTGEVLQGLGAIESDIYMNGDKINIILGKHPEMGLEQIKQIPQILDDPVIVLNSRGKRTSGNSTRIVAFGNVKAQNGAEVVAILDLRPEEGGFVIEDMQKVNSAYTKSNPKNLVENSEILYVDKKRATQLLRGFGLATMSQSLLPSGYIGTITYSGGKVNIKGRMWGDIYSETANSENVKVRFSMSEPVEQTETLIAVHNMDADKLRRTLELGAWPAPSIAIVRAEQGHAEFGEYSAVFPRGTIDPETDSRNHVYGSDAWTPTHSNALIESEVNYGTMRTFDAMIYNMSGEFAGGAFAHRSALSGILDGDSTTKTLDDIAKSLSQNDAVRAAYLQERGESLEPVMAEKTFDSFGNAALQRYIEKIGYQELARLSTELMLGSRLAETDLESAKDAIIDAWTETNERRLNRKPELREKRIKATRDRLEDYRVEQFIENAWEYYENHGALSDEIDRNATRQAMSDLIVPGGSWDEVARVVQDWVRPKLEGVLGESGVYNGRDRITDTGRRSFAQTHYPVTAENIVRAMYGQGNRRGEGTWGTDAESLSSVATPEYSSVDEMHADEGRLRTEDEGTYKALMQEIDADIYDFVERAMEAMEAHASNSYEERDIIGYVLMQAAGQNTARGVQRVFNDEGYKLPMELAQAALDVYRKAATAPTKYFEAKPERVVELGEALAVVAPNSAPADLIDQMRNRGVDVLTYETGNQQDRLRVLNGIQDARFSISADETEALEETDATRQAKEEAEQEYLQEKQETQKQKTVAQYKKKLKDLFPADTYNARSAQTEIVNQLVESIQQTGAVNQATIDETYDRLWKESEAVDKEMANEYAQLKNELRGGVRVSEDLKKEIADYNQFRKQNWGLVQLKNSGASVDEAYAEWSHEFPSLFPDDIVSEYDQVNQMIDVARMLKNKTQSMEEYFGFDDAYMGAKVDYVDFVHEMEEQLAGTSTRKMAAELAERQVGEEREERSFRERVIAEQERGRLETVRLLEEEVEADGEPEFQNEIPMEEVAKYFEENYSPDNQSTMAAAEELARVTKENFVGSPALKELGIHIAGNLADYSDLSFVKQAHENAESVRKDIRKLERKLNPTPTEKHLASGLAAGVLDEANIGSGVDHAKIVTLAEYYIQEQIANEDLLWQRRNAIYADADTAINSLMNGTEQLHTQSSLVTRYRTPYRNMINMFGREQGEKIFGYVFAPTVENGAEMIRWKNKMLDEVREFEGSDGKKKELNKKERALTQMVLEGRAIGEQVKNMVDGELIRYAAEELRKGKAVDDVSNEFGLHSKDARQAAQDYAAWLDVQEELDTTKGADKQRILNAVEKYSEQYNKFYKAINDVLIAHGYEPIGFIKGYAPHLQTEESKNLLQKALESLGVKNEVYSIPASIAGQTYQYRPNKRWNPYFQHRNGNQTDYDIAVGYESYLDYMADIVYHMDDIIRTRRMVNWYRTTYSPEEIRENLSWAGNLRTASVEQKAEYLREAGELGYGEYPNNERINQLFEDYVDKQYKNIQASGKYNNVVTWLEDYANGLAAKQSDIDRGTEALLGRNALNIAGKFNRLFAQSNVAGNVTSALNQTSQIPFIIAQNGYNNYVQALRDYARRPAIRKEFRDGSDFLTMKAGVDNLVIDPGAEVLNLMFKGAEIMDSMTSYLAVRSAYYKAIKEGMSHEDAMQYADRMGEQLMGSRAKENAPTAFRSRSPLLKMVNTFQIEALNTFEYVAQDTIIQGIREIKQINDTKGRTKAIAALISLVGQMLASAFIHNRLSEELYGGTPTQFDLGGYAAEFLASGNGITVNDQLKHWFNLIWEWVAGEPLFEEDNEYNEEFDWGSAVKDLGYSVTSDIPFARSLMGLLGWGDETLPTQDVSTVYDTIKSAAENGMNMETLDKAITAVSEFVPGGRQVRKTATGFRMMAEGGRYYGYGDNKRLQYTVDDTALNWIKAALFGPNGLNETREHYASGDGGWGATTTQKYQDLIQNGLTQEQAVEVVEEYQRINALESMTASEQAMEFKRTLNEMGLDEDMQQYASEAFGYYTVIRGQTTQYDKLLEEGLSANDAAELTTALSDLEPEGDRTTVSNLQKYREIIDFTSNEATRYAALAGVMPEKEMARFKAAYDYVDTEEYVEFLERFDDAYPGESKSQEKVKDVLKGMNISTDAKAALWQMCDSSWKPEKNPFKESTGKKVAQAIEDAYAKLDEN